MSAEGEITMSEPAWIVGIVFVANLVLGIVVAVKLNELNHAFANIGNPTPSSTCLSQGGYDPSAKHRVHRQGGAR
jgi:hypothetical protein